MRKEELDAKTTSVVTSARAIVAERSSEKTSAGHEQDTFAEIYIQEILPMSHTPSTSASVHASILNFRTTTSINARCSSTYRRVVSFRAYIPRISTRRCVLGARSPAQHYEQLRYAGRIKFAAMSFHGTAAVRLKLRAERAPNSEHCPKRRCQGTGMPI